jgi:hypothetical protein
MSAINRLLYYDGEFLRAFDFQDEQTYHREMRRRLNRYLHLPGIVQGLQLIDDVQATVHSVSIQPGLAIDAFGREIYVFEAYTLGDQDIQTNRIPAGAANYDVWLRYDKTPQTPPSSGYSNCNQANQLTRWMEGFSVQLLKHGTVPFTAPAFTDDDSDDPDQDRVGVLLGTVAVDPGSATLQFSIPTAMASPIHDRFWGSIIQRIHTPPGYDATKATPPFNFQKKNSPRNPPASLDIEPNIFAGQNMILGPDYDLTTSGGNPTSFTPNPVSPNAPGSLKLAGDLFVAGNIYSLFPDPLKPKWQGLQGTVQQMVQQNLPEIIPFTSPSIAVNTAATGYDGTGAYAVGVTTVGISTQRITNVSLATAFACFSSINLTPKANFSALLTIGAPILQVVTPPTAIFPPNNQNGQVNISWLVGPAATGGPPISPCFFESFTFSGFVVCFPKTP